MKIVKTGNGTISGGREAIKFSQKHVKECLGCGHMEILESLQNCDTKCPLCGNDGFTINTLKN